MSPTPRLILLVLFLAASSIFPSLYPSWLIPWLALPLLFLLSLLFNAWQLLSVKLNATRKIAHVLLHGAWSPVVLSIENHSKFGLKLRVHDMHPYRCNILGLPQTTFVKAEQSASIKYDIQSENRGDLAFDGIDCYVSTGLGLLNRKITIACASEVRVYPNFKANRLFGLLTSKHHLEHLGIKRLPRQGQGNDFHQLREYQEGDSLRQLDWKATSRMRKLISREYTQERDQQIVFLLDCSMRMRHKDGQTSHMDETLNAVVLLSHLALQQGDATGIMTFGGVDRWLPAAKGPAAARRLMQEVYDLEATRELPDYVAAVETLARRLSRRALVILITNLRVEDGQSVQQALQRLKKRHMVLIADLRESDLERASNTLPKTAEDAVLWLAAEGYRQDRKQQHNLAIASGARILDVEPSKLSADLITRYLTIKRLGQL